MLRYSDWNILSTLAYDGGYIRPNGNISIDQNQMNRFKDLVSSTMNQAALEAASNARKFYTIKANWTTLQTLYELVQCTPDLKRQDCLTCLQRSINGMPLYKTGGRSFSSSCNSRYELFAFYNETAVRTQPQQQAPPPTLLPSVSTLSLPGKGWNSNVLVVAIAVSIIVVVLLLIAGHCYLAKRVKKSSDIALAFDAGDDITTIDSLQLDYRTIRAATNKYSEKNKIGQGGFGEVYKGTFSNGTEVAVKRLSKSSGQGDTESKKRL